MNHVDLWAKSQGFEQFVKDHRTVMNNLERWLSEKMTKSQLEVSELVAILQIILEINNQPCGEHSQIRAIAYEHIAKQKAGDNENE